MPSLPNCLYQSGFPIKLLQYVLHAPLIIPLYFINLIIHLVNSINTEPFEYSAFSNLLHFLPPRLTYFGTTFSDVLNE